MQRERHETESNCDHKKEHSCRPAGHRKALQIEHNPIAWGWVRLEGRLWAAQCHEHVCVVEGRSACQSAQQAEELTDF